jgi:hypothetical protein
MALLEGCQPREPQRVAVLLTSQEVDQAASEHRLRHRAASRTLPGDLVHQVLEPAPQWIVRRELFHDRLAQAIEEPDRAEVRHADPATGNQAVGLGSGRHHRMPRACGAGARTHRCRSVVRHGVAAEVRRQDGHAIRASTQVDAAHECKNSFALRGLAHTGRVVTAVPGPSVAIVRDDQWLERDVEPIQHALEENFTLRRFRAVGATAVPSTISP